MLSRSSVACECQFLRIMDNPLELLASHHMLIVCHDHLTEESENLISEPIQFKAVPVGASCLRASHVYCSSLVLCASLQISLHERTPRKCSFIVPEKMACLSRNCIILPKYSAQRRYEFHGKNLLHHTAVFLGVVFCIVFPKFADRESRKQKDQFTITLTSFCFSSSCSWLVILLPSFKFASNCGAPPWLSASKTGVIILAPDPTFAAPAASSAKAFQSWK